MPTFSLYAAVQRWDREYAASLPPSSHPVPQPYARQLQALIQVAHLRYQPFQNDAVQDYRGKLQTWLAQIPEDFQRHAFLFALRVVFITERQFEALQRQLFSRCLRRALLDSAISRHSLPPLSYDDASSHLDEEMDTTLFVANSDSAHLNAFAHINDPYFHDRARRRLLGPDVHLWIYARQRLAQTPPLSVSAQQTALRFETDVLTTDKHLQNKTRLVVVDDFAGTGEDFSISLQYLHQCKLPFTDIILAPTMITQFARNRLTMECQKASTVGRTFSLQSAYVLPERFRCFNSPHAPYPSPDPSYLDGNAPIEDLSSHIARLAEHLQLARFAPHGVPTNKGHGFGGLALAFVFHSNAPDNSLPLLWSTAGDWYPLFRRATNYL